MATSMLIDLQNAQLYLTRAIKEAESDQNIGLNADLLRALLMMDEKYKEFTILFDKDDDLKPGTTYNSPGGINIEFYVEAEEWHDVSKALRQWKETNENWAELLDVDVDDVITFDD